MEDEDDERDYQQDVDQAARYTKGQATNPEDDEDSRNGEEHNTRSNVKAAPGVSGE